MKEVFQSTINCLESISNKLNDDPKYGRDVQEINALISDLKGCLAKCDKPGVWLTKETKSKINDAWLLIKFILDIYKDMDF